MIKRQVENKKGCWLTKPTLCPPRDAKETLGDWPTGADSHKQDDLCPRCLIANPFRDLGNVS